MASRFFRLLSHGKEVAARVLPSASSASRSSFLPRPFSTLIEEDVVKAAFVKQQQQFRQYLQGLSSISIPLNPEDDKAVKQYAQNVKAIREKVGIPSYSEKMADLLESAEEDASDVRSFLSEATSLRKQLGIEDTLGVEPLMLAALDKVEKKIGKPLTTADTQGLAAFQEQVAAINTKLGLKESDLEKLEEQLDLALAKSEIKAFRDEALDKINTYKRRDGLDAIDLDLKELKPTAFL